MAKLQSAELTQEQIDAIDNYGNSITTMKDFVSICRRRPGYQIGAIGDRGFLNMMREVFQNSVDQIMDKTSPCNNFSFKYDMRNLEVTVIDNGKGFPFDDMIRILTKEYTSKNYEKKLYEYSSGMHGVGLKVCLALSETATVDSYRYDGTAKRFEFKKGYPVYNELKDIPNKDHFQGSIVRFTPDLDIMGDISLDWKEPYKLIKHIISITPIGTQMDFIAIDLDGVEHKEHIVNKDGIITDLIMKVKNPIIKPIIFGFDDGTHKIEAAFTYDGGDDKNPPDFEPRTTSFANFCPTSKNGGTHVDGTIDGIVRWFSNYMNKVYLINQKSKEKTVVTFADIKTGLNLFVAAAHLEPILQGQSKDVLTNKDMEPFCKEVVMRSLDEWSKSNPGDLAKLSKYFKDIAEIRMKTDKEKVKIVTKYQENSLTGLPAKYSRPKGKCEELIIVEGDSAGGSAKTAKGDNQGIFPLRGKIPSAFEHTKQKFLDNAEIQGIARIILGKPYTRNFDINDVVWDKIIFMCDADVDGAHISSLLLRYFILYMPQLLEAGKVYKSVPPLYSMNKGNNTTYFTDKIEFVKYVQKSFINHNKIIDIKTKQPVSGRDMTLLFMNNEDYVYQLERMATTYAVEPKILEMALFAYLYNKKLTEVSKRLKNEFRFMNVSQDKHGNFIFDGTAKTSNFLFVDQRLINDCDKIIKIINKNRVLYYLLNDQESSIYDIMKAFEMCTPSHLQRYKGLGEMNPDQLGESTLLPNSDRMLIRYTLEDAKEELGIIREYESDRSKLLDLVGTVKRIDLED